jgi:hypothetical protein
LSQSNLWQADLRFPDALCSKYRATDWGFGLLILGVAGWTFSDADGALVGQFYLLGRYERFYPGAYIISYLAEEGEPGIFVAPGFRGVGERPVEARFAARKVGASFLSLVAYGDHGIPWLLDVAV